MGIRTRFCTSSNSSGIRKVRSAGAFLSFPLPFSATICTPSARGFIARLASSAEHQFRRRNRYGLVLCRIRNESTFAPARLPTAAYPHATNGRRKKGEEPRKLYIPALVASAYFCHYLLRNSGMDRLLGDTLCTVAASRIQFSISMAILDALHLGVRINSRA